MRSGAAGTRVVRAAAWLLPRVPRLPSGPRAALLLLWLSPSGWRAAGEGRPETRLWSLTAQP